MRAKRLRSARVISAGHAFVQNLRRGHYELGWMLIHGTGSRRSLLNSPTPSEQVFTASRLSSLPLTQLTRQQSRRRHRQHVRSAQTGSGETGQW
jgi:hypothetical protein